MFTSGRKTMLAHRKEPSGIRAPLEQATLVMQNGGNSQRTINIWGRDYFTKLFWCSPKKKKKKSVDVLLENVPWMLKSTEDIKNITFSSYATSPNDNFSGKMWFGLFFFLCRLQRAAAAGLQPAPVHQSALCLRRWSWSELTVFGKHFAYFCLFWHLLRARSAEGRPHVCVCGGEKPMAPTLEPYCSFTINIPTQCSKIVKICVKLQSGIHEAIFI